MAIIEKEIELRGTKGRLKLAALFDSGSTFSCIKRDLAQKLGEIVNLPEPLELELAEEGRTVRVNELLHLNFYIDGYRFLEEFLVVPSLSENVIIGTATMQKWRFKLDFEHEEVIIDPRVTKLRLI